MLDHHKQFENLCKETLDKFAKLCDKHGHTFCYHAIFHRDGDKDYVSYSGTSNPDLGTDMEFINSFTEYSIQNAKDNDGNYLTFEPE